MSAAVVIVIISVLSIMYIVASLATGMMIEKESSTREEDELNDARGKSNFIHNGD